jgi:hypothetical protein
MPCPKGQQECGLDNPKTARWPVKEFTGDGLAGEGNAGSGTAGVHDQRKAIDANRPATLALDSAGRGSIWLC